MQGHTDAAWRHAHRRVFGDGVRYFSPFLRIEKGEVRRRDLRDITSPLNEGSGLTPQLIFGTADELAALTDTVRACGYSTADLNLGCPFPPQCRHGRGAGLLARPEVLAEAVDVIASATDIGFSVKMRLGLERPDEWEAVMPVINSMRLTHITVHPRTARQQYSGPLSDSSIFEASAHPVIFNGDILSPADIESVRQRHPSLAGVMAGRGLLGRPSLFAEWLSGEERDHARRLSDLLQMHGMILDCYTSSLCGESQILSKIKPFWEYAAEEIGPKAYKNIRKARSLEKYLGILSSLD